MNRRHIVVGMLTLLWALTLAAASKFGLHYGPIAAEDLDSSARAALLTHELVALRSAQTDTLIRTKEIELNGQVVRAIQCQSSGCGSLFWSMNDAYDHEQDLRKVAEYRKEHPPPVVPDNPKIVPGMYDPGPFAREVQDSTRILLERYAK